MNKIVLHIGLFAFCMSLVFFSQQNIALQDVLVRSFIVFFIVTFMGGIIAIAFIKSINKTLMEKKLSHDKIMGSDHE